MAATGYVAYALTGGSTTSLDYIDGTGLADGDFAFVFVSGVLYHYILDDDSAAAESSPDVIAPDANAGNKRWILQNGNLADIAALTIAQGDLIYGSAANTIANLAKSTANFKLFMNAAGTLPEWASGAKVVSSTFDLATATGTFNITGAGFKPSVAIVLASVAGEDYFSAGFSAGGTDGCVVLFYSGWSAGYALPELFRYNNGTNIQKFTLSAFIADGMTVAHEKVNSPTGTLTIKTLFLR